MNVRNADHHLLKEVLGLLLCKPLSPAHVVQEIAALAQLHDEEGVSWYRDFFVAFHHILVVQLGHVLELLLNLIISAGYLLLGVCFLVRRLLHQQVDALNGHHLTSELVQSKVDFSKGTFAKHFTYFVEFKLCFGCFIIFLEAVFEMQFLRY